MASVIEGRIDYDPALVTPLPRPVLLGAYLLMGLFSMACYLGLFMAIKAVWHLGHPVTVASAAPSRSFTVLAPSGAPAIRWNADDRRLIVTASATRDTFVCLRGECRLVEEWLGK